MPTYQLDNSAAPKAGRTSGHIKLPKWLCDAWAKKPVRRLLLGLTVCIPFLLGWFVYRAVYHPDIRAESEGFVQALANRDADRLYDLFDDNYRSRLTRHQSRRFLGEILPLLPQKMQLKAIEHQTFLNGSDEYIALVTYIPPPKANRKTNFLRVALCNYGKRGWHVVGVTALETFLWRCYGERDKWVREKLQEAVNSPP